MTQNKDDQFNKQAGLTFLEALTALFDGNPVGDGHTCSPFLCDGFFGISESPNISHTFSFRKNAFSVFLWDLRPIESLTKAS